MLRYSSVTGVGLVAFLCILQADCWCWWPERTQSATKLFGVLCISVADTAIKIVQRPSIGRAILPKLRAICYCTRASKGIRTCDASWKSHTAGNRMLLALLLMMEGLLCHQAYFGSRAERLGSGRQFIIQGEVFQEYIGTALPHEVPNFTQHGVFGVAPRFQLRFRLYLWGFPQARPNQQRCSRVPQLKMSLPTIFCEHAYRSIVHRDQCPQAGIVACVTPIQRLRHGFEHRKHASKDVPPATIASNRRNIAP